LSQKYNDRSHDYLIHGYHDDDNKLLQKYSLAEHFVHLANSSNDAIQDRSWALNDVELIRAHGKVMQYKNRILAFGLNEELAANDKEPAANEIAVQNESYLLWKDFMDRLEIQYESPAWRARENGEISIPLKHQALVNSSALKCKQMIRFEIFSF
jgi:hypothetical protein